MNKHIRNLPFDDYLQLDGASVSFLMRLLDKSPLHALHYRDEPSPAKTLGTLLHLLLLQPERKDEVFIRPADADRSSNANKQHLLDFWCDIADFTPSEVPYVNGKPLAPGKLLDVQLLEAEAALALVPSLIVTEEQYEQAKAMVRSVMDNKNAAFLMAQGEAEATLTAEDPYTGMPMRGRIDWVPAWTDTLIEVKTTSGITASEFARTARQLDYHTQASYYRNLWELVHGKRIAHYKHLVIESSPPYQVALFELGERSLELGRKRWRKALELFARCNASNLWPGPGYSWEEGDYVTQTIEVPIYDSDEEEQ